MNIQTIYGKILPTLILLLVVSILSVFVSDSLIPIVLVLVLLLALGSGFRKIPSDPLTYGIITFFGKRLDISVEEGWRFIPIIFGFSVEHVEIRNEPVEIPVTVITKSGIEISGKLSLQLRPKLDSLKLFIDNGGYSKLTAVVGDIGQTATRIVCNGESLDNLTMHSGEWGKAISNHLEPSPSRLDLDPNDDLRRAGVSLIQVQINFEQPAAIMNARISVDVAEREAEAYRQQTKVVNELAQERYKILKRKKPLEAIISEIETGMELARNQAQKVSGGGRPVVVTQPKPKN